MRALALVLAVLSKIVFGLNTPLKLFSPAKVNLFLRVMGKRDDGFHELASLFQAIDIGDILSFEIRESEDLIECNIPGLPTDDSNLVTRAINLYRSKVPEAPFVHCKLDKRLPMEAGLGGGSSNAATTLYAMNLLTHSAATQEELIEWSAELGSDITFFLGPTGTAYCTGRGEIIQPIDLIQEQELFVIKPAMGLSTPLVFKTLANTNYATLSPRHPKDILQAFSNNAGPLNYINDLEPPAFEIQPILDQVKQKLLAYFPAGAMMSGSGTSLFGILSKKQRTDLSLESFPIDFQHECKRDLDLDLAVWRCRFCFRGYSDPNDSSSPFWYPFPEELRFL
mmetsp:Transcript_3895/g.5447  ORF Transcript_3895/g.5447 Transcript_3895/m.5447 type:complete len:338 (-) Transcript_3895:1652-2665(-)